MAKSRETQPRPVTLSPNETAELFDKVSRERIGVPGKEFAERFARGELHGDTSAEVETAMLLPFARRKTSQR